MWSVKPVLALAAALLIPVSLAGQDPQAQQTSPSDERTDSEESSGSDRASPPLAEEQRDLTGWHDYLSEPRRTEVEELLGQIEELQQRVADERLQLFEEVERLAGSILDEEIEAIRSSWEPSADGEDEEDAATEAESDAARLDGDETNRNGTNQEDANQNKPNQDDSSPRENGSASERIREFLSDSSVAARHREARGELSDTIARLRSLVESELPGPDSEAFLETVRYFASIRQSPAVGVAVESGIFERLRELVEGQQRAEVLNRYRRTLGYSPADDESSSGSAVVARYQAEQALRRWWLELMLSDGGRTAQLLRRQSGAASELSSAISGRIDSLAREVQQLHELHMTLDEPRGSYLATLSLAWFHGNQANRGEGDRLRSLFRNLTSVRHLYRVVRLVPTLYGVLSFWDVTLSAAPEWALSSIARNLEMADAEIEAVRATAYAVVERVETELRAAPLRDRVRARVSSSMASSAGDEAEQNLAELQEEGRRAISQFDSGAGADSARWLTLAIMSNRYAQYLLATDPAYREKRGEFEQLYRSIFDEVDRRFRQRLARDGGTLPGEEGEQLGGTDSGSLSASEILTPGGARAPLSRDLLPYDRTLLVEPSLSRGVESGQDGEDGTADRSGPGGEASDSSAGDGEKGNRASALADAIAQAYYRAFYEVTQPDGDPGAGEAERRRWGLSHGLLVLPETGASLSDAVAPWFQTALETETQMRASYFTSRGLVKLEQRLRNRIEGPAGKVGIAWNALVSARMRLTLRELREHANFQQSNFETEIALAELWLSGTRERPGRRLLDVVEQIETSLSDGAESAWLRRVRELRGTLLVAEILDSIESAGVDAVRAAERRLEAYFLADVVAREIYEQARRALPPVQEQEEATEP